MTFKAWFKENGTLSNPEAFESAGERDSWCLAKELEAITEQIGEWAIYTADSHQIGWDREQEYGHITEMVMYSSSEGIE